MGQLLYDPGRQVKEEFRSPQWLSQAFIDLSASEVTRQTLACKTPPGLKSSSSYIHILGASDSLTEKGQRRHSQHTRRSHHDRKYKGGKESGVERGPVSSDLSILGHLVHTVIGVQESPPTCKCLRKATTCPEPDLASHLLSCLKPAFSISSQHTGTDQDHVVGLLVAGRNAPAPPTSPSPPGPDSGFQPEVESAHKRQTAAPSPSCVPESPLTASGAECPGEGEPPRQDMGQPAANTSEGHRHCRFSEDYKRVYLPLTYSVIFVLGLPLNATVLWLSWRGTKRWSCATIYLVNLMVADLLYVLTLPFLIVAYSLGDSWPFGELLCRLVRFLFYTNLYSGILLLTCISVHRFLGVCHPLRSLPFRTRRHALRGTAATWALVALQLLPTLVFSHTDHINDHTVCYDLASPENFHQFFAYGIVLTLSGFVLPSLVISVCYSLMLRSLAKPEESLVRTGLGARARSIRTILLVCGLFALCFLPFHLARSFYLTLRFLSSQDCQLLRVASLAYKLWRPLVSMSSCLNPVLYFLSGGNKVRLFQELRQNKAGQRPRGQQIWVMSK
ncbi:P2Y purinoceptor 2 [Galemys pyrenaicus]|uniref:P2Y purinoceptor 2 n=1 Tax=Galemys pyrenaicus TaxID=202257 RepID=A0A8J6A224_GALPY|nr:P2Y purinoceptor 2 [Galemys pyrenaicus]